MMEVEDADVKKKKKCISPLNNITQQESSRPGLLRWLVTAGNGKLDLTTQ